MRRWMDDPVLFEFALPVPLVIFDMCEQLVTTLALKCRLHAWPFPMSGRLLMSEQPAHVLAAAPAHPCGAPQLSRDLDL
jgi:hypothetical protein